MGTSLVVQWLRPHTFTAEDLGSILVREQRFHKLHRVAKIKNLPHEVDNARQPDFPFYSINPIRIQRCS